MAVSTASAPEFMGSTLWELVRSQSSLYSSPSWSLRKAREVRVSFSAWSARARLIFGWQWPWFTAE